MSKQYYEKYYSTDNKQKYSNTKKEDYYIKKKTNQEDSTHSINNTNNKINDFRQYVIDKGVFKRKADWSYYYIEETKQVVLEYKFWKFFESLIDDKIEQDKRKQEDEERKKELDKKKEFVSIIDTSMNKFTSTLTNLENMQAQMINIMDKISNNVIDSKNIQSNKVVTLSKSITNDQINIIDNSDNEELTEINLKKKKRKNNIEQNELKSELDNKFANMKSELQSMIISSLDAVKGNSNNRNQDNNNNSLTLKDLKIANKNNLSNKQNDGTIPIETINDSIIKKKQNEIIRIIKSKLNGLNKKTEWTPALLEYLNNNSDKNWDEIKPWHSVTRKNEAIDIFARIIAKYILGMKTMVRELH